MLVTIVSDEQSASIFLVVFNAASGGIIHCVRKVAVHLGYGTVRVQACVDARGHHFQRLLLVNSNFPNACV
jgi:hypothetical protein